MKSKETLLHIMKI